MIYAKNSLAFDQYNSFNIIRVSDSVEDRTLHENNLDEVGIESFADAHPEFHRCGENATALSQRLAEYGDGEKLPSTCRNLELVYRELLEEGRLTLAPPIPAPVADKSRGIVQSRSDALLEHRPSPQEVAALAKLADDPALNDHQRKQRLRKLAALAGEERRQNSTLPRHYGQL